MKTEKILLKNDTEGMETALKAVEELSAENHLSEKERIHLRLLCEEMLGISRVLTGEPECYFWIVEDNPTFELHLSVHADMDEQQKEELIKVSSSGQNYATRGIGGKLRELFLNAMTGAGGMTYLVTDYDSVTVRFGMYGMKDTDREMWSLLEYKNEIRAKRAQMQEAWDELEKSIVAKLSDDVRVSIIGNDVEMVIIKTF